MTSHSLVSPSTHLFPVPNKPSRFCGRKATSLLTYISQRLVSRGASARFRFSSPFSSLIVAVCGHCLVILFLTITETLKRLSTPPILMQESFWWWQCSDRYIISLPLPPPPYPLPPFPPSLISLMVSVDVKHHVYLLLDMVNP